MRLQHFLHASLLLAATLGTLPGANPVIDWNQFATGETPLATDPLNETRVLAITHIAIHDAMSAIKGRYEPYAFRSPYDLRSCGPSPEAAIAAAARETLVALLPTRRASIEAKYAQVFAALPDGRPKQCGLDLGRHAGRTILELRTRDGSDSPGFSKVGTKPGEYRPTAPDFTPAFLPDWGRVDPFALKHGAQFRPAAPPRLQSPEYAADFHEVKLIGQDTSTVRTEEQSEIARYWYEASGQGWNRVARVLAGQRGLDLSQSARLFALANIAMADGFIGGFEAKYHYDFWRPSTAIAEGDADNNDHTAGDPRWNNFLPTPPVPDYPSTHSLVGAAAARALALALGTDLVSFEMTSGAPFEGLTRRFWSLSEAAQENASSRVLAGIHFPSACRAGVRQGEQIGEYVFANLLQSVR